MHLWSKIAIKLFGTRYSPDRALYRKNLGTLKKQEMPGAALVSYEANDRFDYETYRKIQTLGNHLKLEKVFARESVIAAIAKFASARVQPRFVLCHGTRNGAEQAFFRQVLPNARVLGTEISDTAHNFRDTIQWDFHEVNAAWTKSADIVYSNSWDHAYNPDKAFRAWSDSLSEGGLLTLEHTKFHEASEVNELDPYGASLEGLIASVQTSTGRTFIDVLSFDDDRATRVAIFG